MLAPWTGSVSADSFVLDVREPGEVAAGSIPGSVNIPLGQLRSRLHELPRDKAVLITCAVGQRGYYACRILTQYGFDARNLSGGYSTYRVLKTMKE
jgi:rhodanese-related sulfurtransferase